ncbi:hypothetical protein [Streptomyces sp. NPDC047525]|uniref:hypothetical protein n=1 Tax=Streptomyces sp. NPDC047525 TaxID=3155264 RepID=UPI0033CC9738
MGGGDAGQQRDTDRDGGRGIPPLPPTRPGLARAGPDRFAEPLAQTLRSRAELHIPDMEVAILQFYALVLYPHIVHSA